LCGDGDLQEPVALGACALAGHWKLGRLVAYYDRNQVQISGSTDRVDSTVYEQLFKSIGWQVLEVDGHSEGRIKAAIQHAHQATEQPTLIIGNTTMAHGTATVEGLAATHGAPLAPEEIAATKEKLGLLPDQYFQFSDAAFAGMRTRHETLRTKVGRWQTVINKKREDTEFDALWRNYFGELASDDLPWPSFEPGSKIATRKAFGQVLDALAPALPVLVGGSADLEPSNNTANFAKQYGDFNCDNRGGRSLAYGVREFPMGAINNGIALHGGLIPFGATFLVFTDYEKPALRLRALQKLHAIGIYTHDSIYVGEDGPTHQPVEQIMSLRLIPDMLVFRPADATETVASMRAILTRTDRPSALVLSRQSLPVLQSDMQKRAVVGVQQGAYVIKEAEQEAQVTIFAAGSEVSLALEVCDLLTDTAIRVISAPCWELFFEQPVDYQESILDSGNALAVSIEAGATAGWERFTGNQGLNIGIDCFGASAPGDTVARQLGLDPAAISARITQILKERET
ncbi:MAG: transketolase, partial [Candidatus Marinimicrobia bacterium]|nr:transketolase [Candidatus Neomarinimicrobiota bacterium]